MYNVNDTRRRLIPKSHFPNELYGIIPEKVIKSAEEAIDSCGGLRLEELRLRADRCASVIIDGNNRMLSCILGGGELRDILNSFGGGSLYAVSDSINQGFITTKSGVRVGVCGRATCEDGKIIGVYEISALTVRIPHRHIGVGGAVARLVRESGSRGVLVWSPPGVGKTTLLRSVAAELSSGESPLRVGIIDTRGELSFSNDSPEYCLDILSGYPRKLGIEIASRTMNEQVVICDEIGDCDEAFSLISCCNCGIPLVASAHAGDLSGLLRRSGISILHEARVFAYYVGIRRNSSGSFKYDIKSWEEADGIIGNL